MNDARKFRSTILRWYTRQRRSFPWRRTRDPYRILVSEVMLQQTQVSRVALKYPEFLKRYPTIASLARASKADVLRSWSGMGYNNRAVRLHAAVKEVAARYDGVVPSDPAELEKLPGIGRYTSHAVAGFAYGRRVPVVDVNIRRVLSRVFARMDGPSMLLPEKRTWEIAREILPRSAYDWNQALMDFGSQVCGARKPRCSECPVRTLCSSGGLLEGMSAGMSGPVPPRSARPEPSFGGVPLRIWRGRIVEALRRKRGHAPVSEIAKEIGMAPSNVANVASAGGVPRVMLRLADSLERDGLITVRRGRKPSLSLAS